MNRRGFLRHAALAACALPLLGCAGAVPRAFAQPGLSSSAARPGSDFVVEGKIAYVKGGDIWSWSDGQSRQISRGNAYEGPDWSPDGTRLVASYMGENHSEIVVITEAGARVRQLTHNWSPVSIKDQAWGRKPVWSPNGQHVAYVSDQGAVVDGVKALDMSLFTVDSDGTNLRKLVVQKLYTGGLDWPTWSSDGERIAYTSFDNGPSQIQVYNLLTSEWLNLTNQAEGAYDPAWSPDGRWIACAVREKGRSDIYVMAADGSGPTRVTDTGASRAPTWSPDSQLLAYIANVGGSFDLMAVKLGLADSVVASDPRQLTRGEGVETPSGISWAR